MSKRKAISKKLRFEVFKRDSFTCQYCGKKAPDVVLNADHIKPVASGGKTNLINLITSCVDCNLGKGKRELSDDTVAKKQQRQLEELQTRREQLDMMLQWKRGLSSMNDETVEYFEKLWRDLSGYDLTHVGKKKLLSSVKKYTVEEISTALDSAADTYFKYDEDGNVTKESVEIAFSKVERICRWRRLVDEKPHLKEIFHLKSIVCKQNDFAVSWKVRGILEAAYDRGVPIERLKQITFSASSWSEWRDTIETEPAGA